MGVRAFSDFWIWVFGFGFRRLLLVYLIWEEVIVGLFLGVACVLGLQDSVWNLHTL